MNSKTTLTIVFIVIIAIVGYFLLRPKNPSETSGSTNQVVNKIPLPSLSGSTNPLENKPDVNPVNASNPLRSIKTNPFQ